MSLRTVSIRSASAWIPVVLLILVFLSVGVFTTMAFTIQEGNPDNLKEVVKSNNAFTLDLYRNQAKSEDGNLMLSPASVSTVMAMLYAGAVNETREQIQKVLHFQANEESLHDGFSQLTQHWNNADSVELNMANRLWPAIDQNILPEYMKLTKENYGANIERVDYSNPSAAVETINQWVAGQTNDRIKDLLTADNVDASTGMVLTNAIYFKGNWKFKFSERMTKDGDFTTADGTTLSTSMMLQKNKFAFANINGTKLLEMPYSGDQYSMLFILPETNDGLTLIESDLTAEKLDGWIERMSTQKVQVQLPKFKSEVRIDLTKRLSDMGMANVFGPSADFSKMTGQAELFVDKVIHKTFIEVNEEGAEAAAATAATMKLAAPRDEEVMAFIADKPFMYLIRDRETGAILFLGRLVTPTS